MSNETVVLITGANRGLGLGLAKLYLAQPNTRVILTARSGVSSSSSSLCSSTADNRIIIDTLPKPSPTSSHPGILHGIYKLDSSSTSDAISLRNTLQSDHEIKKIDIVIANAGIGEPFDNLLDAPADDALETFFRVNAIGPVRLYQQLWKDFLDKSDNPKFILISSILGSLQFVDLSPCGGYGASKAAANYFVRKMHLENEKLVAVSVHPGWVKTANGQAYANAVGISEPPRTVQESVDAIFKTVSEATKNTTSGKFIDVMTGEELPW